VEGDGGGVVEIAVVGDLGGNFPGAGWEEVAVDFEAEFDWEVEESEDFFWW